MIWTLLVQATFISYMKVKRAQVGTTLTKMEARTASGFVNELTRSALDDCENAVKKTMAGPVALKNEERVSFWEQWPGHEQCYLLERGQSDEEQKKALL